MPEIVLCWTYTICTTQCLLSYIRYGKRGGDWRGMRLYARLGRPIGVTGGIMRLPPHRLRSSTEQTSAYLPPVELGVTSIVSWSSQIEGFVAGMAAFDSQTSK